MELDCLLPDPSVLALRGVSRAGGTYHLSLEVTAAAGACPACGVASGRVHSRYARHPDDLPVSGLRVRLELRVRKFFCDNPDCERRVFCERLPKVLAAYARRTLRLAQVLTHLALLLSAHDAQRVGRALGLPGSVSGFLRLAHAYEPAPVTATAVGIDDFAFRRGHTYGTLIIDLDTHHPVDVLADRSLELVRSYLQQHSEILVIARDRDARYAEAIRWAAPQAVVVLDRWHLLRNLAEAFERHVARHYTAWRTALRGRTVLNADSKAIVPPQRPGSRLSPVTNSELERRRERQAWRQTLFDRVHELHATGYGKSKIMQDTGLSWRTITTYLARDAPPDNSRRARTPSSIDPYAPHLARRWAQGCRNAAQLTREITAMGYTGSKRMVMRYVQAWRSTGPPSHHPLTPPALPAPRTLTWLLLRPPENLNDKETTLTSALFRAVPDAAAVAALARSGSNAIRNRDPAGWQKWSEKVAASDCHDLIRFTAGLKNDQAALMNALSMPYSNGPTEGHVNRVKLIKRSMYGRASFGLLRKKILYQAT